jgi:hypothetical protein
MQHLTRILHFSAFNARSLSIPCQVMTAGSLSIIAARLKKANIPPTGKTLSKAVPYLLDEFFRQIQEIFYFIYGHNINHIV